MTSAFRLQTNYNTTPQGLEALSAPLLAEYAAGETVITHWHDYITRELDGDRDWVEVGLPWVEVFLYRVSRAEFALLMTYEGEVSIRVLNQTLNQYLVYNAKLKPPEANSSDATWSADAIQGWNDVKLTFFDLVIQS